MCYSCGKHVTQRLWYLEPEKHRIAYEGLLPRIVERFLYQGVKVGLKSIAKKQPYGTEDRWTGINRGLWDWLAKNVHGFQALPDLESAFKIIDMAHEIGLAHCTCREVMAPDMPMEWKCLGLNYSAKIAFQSNTQPIRPISREEAKDLLTSQREQGCYQSVGWMWDANVNWLCNCDEHCGVHRTAECEWTVIPSFFVSSLVRPEACEGSRNCAQVCQREGAVRFDNDGRFVSDEAHEMLCRGCGLCVERCPTGALGLIPRQAYWDILTKSKKRLPKGDLSI
jgi:NAD-dependent dihydropyrimidine dehydrogenase PreA subunit